MNTIQSNMVALERKMRRIEDECGWTAWANMMSRNSYTIDPIEPRLPETHARAAAKWHVLCKQLVKSWR